MGKAIDAPTFAIGALATAAAFNYAVRWGFDYPIIYCLLNSPLTGLYMAWAHVILLCAAAYIALMLFRGQNVPAFGGAVIIIGIIELPRLAELLFRLGGTCG